jgi:AcrR family transcriptional regulator
MNTEQTILRVAEKLFIEKGYMGVSCTEIAKGAGVNHAMVYYYFRTKEKLFDQIFEQKAVQLLDFFVEAFEKELTFFEKLKIGIEKHFDFIGQNPKFPLFILREIILSPEKKNRILNRMFSAGRKILERMTVAIREEADKGHIRPVQAGDLLLNIAALNVATFVALQVFSDLDKEQTNGILKQFMEERKQNNVNTIINSLKL